jgi:hypothetical protein
MGINKSANALGSIDSLTAVSKDAAHHAASDLGKSSDAM